MKSLDDANWFENCQYKFEYVDCEVRELKYKEKLDIYDEIKINTLLNVLKSPMEYANLELAKILGKKQKSSIPFRKEKYTDEDFMKAIRNKLQYVDQEIFNIFNKLFKDKNYEIFNNMQNDEKHSHINTHYKEVTHTTELAIFPNNIVLKNVSITGPEDFNAIEYNGQPVDLSNSQGYTYEEVYYFYYKNENIGEVFTFLDKVKDMAKEFVEDIKNYIEKL